MFRSIKLVGLLLVTLVCVSSCAPMPSTITAPNIPSTITISEYPKSISLKDLYPSMPSRFEKYKSTLSVSVDKISISKNKIRFTTSLKNISENTFVLKKPKSIGVSGSDRATYDLSVFILSKEGITMSVTSSTSFEYALKTRRLDLLSAGDFIKIQSGESFTLEYEVDLPLVHIEQTQYTGKLPPGFYDMYVIYSNVLIGFSNEIRTPPPEIAKDYIEYQKWDDENTILVDLDAWVGMEQSKTVEIDVPNK